jgi:hypothetical protein
MYPTATAKKFSSYLMCKSDGFNDGSHNVERQPRQPRSSSLLRGTDKYPGSGNVSLQLVVKNEIMDTKICSAKSESHG